MKPSDDNSDKGQGYALVVDDDASLRMVAGEVVARVGLPVESAENGEQALAIVERQMPEICLIDIEMPGMNGFDLCEAIRIRPNGARVPLVVMTGHDDIESIQRAYDAGATDFITKPPNWFIFEQRIRYILRSNRNLQALQQSRQRLANAQRVARVSNWRWDRKSAQLEGSDELLQLFGISPGARIHDLTPIRERVHPDDLERVMGVITGPIDSGRPIEIECRLVTLDGRECVFWTEARLEFDEDGELQGVEGTSQDVTTRKKAEDKIRYLAYHDGLTGLANRRFLVELLDQAVRHARRKETRVGLLYADIDHFKRVNDSFGHAAGDDVLRAVARRLCDSIRDSDVVSRESGEVWSTGIARLGGDEFTVLLSEIRDARSADVVARRILERLREPLEVRGQELVVTASIGISIWPDDCDDADSLIQNADTAMYHAKRERRSSARFYSHSMNEEARLSMRMESRLRRALGLGEIEVHFQPLVDAKTGSLVGAEALARWHDAEVGSIPPDQFIPLAEETGLIDSLGDQVLTKACDHFDRWIRGGLEPGFVAVNVSARQLTRADFAERLVRLIRDTGLEPARVELEFTESLLFEDVDRVAALLDRLTRAGVSASLDDFGTGYSCLQYLKQLPVTTIKIDRSFVRDLSDNPEAGVICNVIIKMAQALGMRTIGEGVENDEQSRLLRAQGCDVFQGYLLSRPLPPQEFEVLLRRLQDGASLYETDGNDGS